MFRYKKKKVSLQDQYWKSKASFDRGQTSTSFVHSVGRNDRCPGHKPGNRGDEPEGAPVTYEGMNIHILLFVNSLILCLQFIFFLF